MLSWPPPRRSKFAPRRNCVGIWDFIILPLKISRRESLKLKYIIIWEDSSSTKSEFVAESYVVARYIWFLRLNLSVAQNLRSVALFDYIMHSAISIPDVFCPVSLLPTYCVMCSLDQLALSVNSQNVSISTVRNIIQDKQLLKVRWRELTIKKLVHF